MRNLHLLATMFAALGAALTGPATAPGQTTAPADASPERIAALIDQLDARQFEVRQQAAHELVGIGAPAAAALRRELDRGSLGYEGQRLARRVLTFAPPAVGVVVRSQITSAEDNGDIIIRFHDQPIENVDQLRAMARSLGEGEVITRRPGVGELQGRLTRSQAMSDALLTWPDARELYRRHGHRGQWDRWVDTGYYRIQFDDYTLHEAFQDAWDQGCRDPQVAWQICRHLRGLTLYDDVTAFLDENLEQIEARYPGGEFRLGQLPAERVRMLLAQGEIEQAQEMLDAALAAADAAGADQAHRVLATLGATMVLFESPREAIAIIDGDGLIPPDTEMATIAQLLAAREGPAEAVEFLQSRPAGLVRDNWLEHYQTQARLAEDVEPTPEVHYVPIWAEPKIGLWRFDGASGFGIPVQNAPLPCRIDLRWRIPIAPRHRDERARGTGVFLLLDGQQSLTSLVLMCTLRGSPMDICRRAGESPGDALLRNRTDLILPAMEYHTARLEMTSRRALVTYDDRPLRRLYHPEPLTGLVRANTICAGISGEFRDVVIASAGPADVEYDEMVELLLQQRLALWQADLPEAERLTEQVLAVLDRMEGVETIAADHEARLDALREMLSDKGLALCTPAICGPQEDRPFWQLESGDLTIPEGRRFGIESTLRLPVFAENFELTGSIYPGRSERARMYIQWNAVGFEPAYPWVWNMMLLERTDEQHFRVLMGGRSQNPAVTTNLVDRQQPIRFRLRVRGHDAAVVFEGVDEALQINNAYPTGRHLLLYGNDFEDRQPRQLYRDLRMRILPEDAPLDAPLAAETPTPPRSR